MIKGTFWPLVVKRFELYLYPLAHVGLVIFASWWQDTADERSPGESMWGTSRGLDPGTTPLCVELR